MGCVLREGGRGMIGMNKVIPGGEGEGADGKELIVTDEEVDGNDEILGEILDGTDEGLVGIDEKLGGTDEEFGDIDERFDGTDEKFGGIDETFGGTDEKFGGTDEKFGVFGVDSAKGKDGSSKIT
ncbi:hypothetical protein U1Q18_033197 [Sarracenia purpurea var. burkii]